MYRLTTREVAQFLLNNLGRLGDNVEELMDSLDSKLRGFQKWFDEYDKGNGEASTFICEIYFDEPTITN